MVAGARVVPPATPGRAPKCHERLPAHKWLVLGFEASQHPCKRALGQR